MPVIIEALTIAGSIGALISWPALVIVVVLYVAFRRAGRDMEKRWRPLLYAFLIL